MKISIFIGKNLLLCKVPYGSVGRERDIYIYIYIYIYIGERIKEDALTLLLRVSHLSTRQTASFGFACDNKHL